MDGRKEANRLHQLGEADKAGTLRAGSSGALVNQHVIGKCHRLSLARYLGLQESHEDHTNTIFESGYANEEVWMSKLALGWHGELTGDSKYPIKWEIDGVTVSGRPDIVLLDDDKKPVFGIELKVVESYKSASSLWYERKPKTDNLIQAAHYSLKFGIPWILVYTFSGIVAPPYWAVRKYSLPKGAEVRPFKMEFPLFWQDGVLGYLYNGDRIMTEITAQSIDDYYQLVVDMSREKDLYLRHSSLDVHGQSQGWNACDYCSAKDACDSYEQHGDYQQWQDELARDWSK